MQTKWNSLVETCVSTAIGYILSYILNLFVVPAVLHVQMSHAQNTTITLIFTVFSLLRGFAVRRWFNRVHVGDVVVAWVRKEYLAWVDAIAAVREEWQK